MKYKNFYVVYTVDKEELRDVNISQKELKALISELFDDLITEGIPLDSIKFDSPGDVHEQVMVKTALEGEKLPQNIDKKFEECKQQKFSASIDIKNTDQNKVQESSSSQYQSDWVTSTTLTDNTTTSNCVQHPGMNVIRTVDVSNRSEHMDHNDNISLECTITTNTVPITTTTVTTNTSHIHTIPGNVFIPQNALLFQPDLLAVPVPGHPSCFQLAKIVQNDSEDIDNRTNDNCSTNNSDNPMLGANTSTNVDSDKEYYKVPFDNNYTYYYISVRRHMMKEYQQKFENLCQNEMRNSNSDTAMDTEQLADAYGFTTYQMQLLQQQMRIHVQMMMQTFLQTYSHPMHWRLAQKAKQMLNELVKKGEQNRNFHAWNLNKAINLMEQWENDLEADTPDNKEMMDFIHREIQLTYVKQIFLKICLVFLFLFFFIF